MACLHGHTLTLLPWTGLPAMLLCAALDLGRCPCWWPGQRDLRGHQGSAACSTNAVPLVIYQQCVVSVPHSAVFLRCETIQPVSLQRAVGTRQQDSAVCRACRIPCGTGHACNEPQRSTRGSWIHLLVHAVLHAGGLLAENAGAQSID
jgi:hypothetical protein